MRFVSFDETTRVWQPEQSQVVSRALRDEQDQIIGYEYEVSGAADHFSEDAITANYLVSTAPLLAGSNVGLQTLSSELSIPIEVPPGRGGLTPQLAFNYSSNRLLGMRGYADHASWVGLGWELDVPNIQIDWWSADPTDPPRAFLSLNGIGGEMLPDVLDGSLYVWRLRDEKYLKVRSTASDFNGVVTVWDQKGTQYVFGKAASSDYERWYRDAQGNRVIYRLDIQYIEDVQGNAVNFEYWQQRLNGPNGAVRQEVMAAYPKRIVYNGGAVEVRFNENDPANSGYDVTLVNPYDSGETFRQRFDTPQSLTDGSCSANPYYIAPRVRETRRLTSIEVRVSGARVRRYDPEFRPTPLFDTACWYEQAAAEPPVYANGLHLNAITMTDRNGAVYNFTRTAFTPFANSMTYRDGSTAVFTYQRPLLDLVTNGFAGVIDFQHQMTGTALGGLHWERDVISSEIRTYGGGQPTVTTTYSANFNAPQYWKQTNPYEHWILDDFGAEFRGFPQVTETGSGSKVVHEYHPTSTYWWDEARAGKEKLVDVQDLSGNSWHKTETTWLVRPVTANGPAGLPDPLVNFVAPGLSKTTLRDGTQQTTTYVYDDNNPCAPGATNCFGLMTQVNVTGVAGAGDDVTTKTAYHQNTANWIFVPKTTAQLDPSNTVLSCARLYYDGGHSIGDAPTDGLVTATSISTRAEGALTAAQCEGTAAIPPTTNSYSKYDQYGNVIEQSNPTGIDPEGEPESGILGWIPSSVSRSVTVYGDVQGVLPTEHTNPLGHKTKIDYHSVFLKPEKVSGPYLTGTDPNTDAGVHRVEFEYDALGRVTRTWDNLGSASAPAAIYTYAWGTIPNKTTVARLLSHGQSWYVESTVCMDGFGREYESHQHYQGDDRNRVRTQYDNRGLVSEKINPTHYGPGAACPPPSSDLSGFDRTKLEYDPLGNAKKTTFLASGQTSGGPFTESIYNGLVTNFVDERGKRTCNVPVPSELKLIVREDAAADCQSGYASTSYEYDRLQRLKKVTDAVGNVTTITYDLAGRKSSMTDPDMGAWQYEYDAAGNLTKQTDARGSITNLAYDAQQRLWTKTYQGPIAEPAVQLYYDDPLVGQCPGESEFALGRLIGMTDGSGARAHCYDIRGRETRSTWEVAGGPYDVSYSYNALDQLVDLTYPDGEVLHHSYSNKSGWLVGVCGWSGSACTGGSSYLANATYTPAGALDLLPLGNGQTTDYGYDYRLRANSIVTGTKQNLALTYDEASNVKTVTDALSAETVTYTYDDLNRLTAATGEAGGGGALYEYNAIGNLTRKKEGTLDLTLNYPASGQGAVRPHAATSATFTGLGGTYKSLAYDANGSLDTVNGAESDYTFDAENRLKQRTHGVATTAYVYDANGTMVKRTTSGPSGSETTVFIGGIYEKNLTTGVVTKYYAAGGRALAMREGPLLGGTLSYLLADHLGGTTTVLDVAGNVTASRKYWPYGAERSVSGDQRASDRWYTGQRDEDFDGLGLYNYKARFYSTTLGRFVSGDSFTPGGSSQGMNRYSYVIGNPLSYNDPTGHCFADLDCSPESAISWFRCALTCGANPLAGLVRVVVHDYRTQFWSSFWGFSSLMEFEPLPARLLSALVEIAGHDRTAFDRVPSWMWRGWAIHFSDPNQESGNMSSAFFEASLKFLMFRDFSIVGLRPEQFIGATPWWSSIAGWGGNPYIDKMPAYELASHYFLHGGTAERYLEFRTHGAAQALGRYTVASTRSYRVDSEPLYWSQFQRTYLFAKGWVVPPANPDDVIRSRPNAPTVRDPLKGY